MSTNKNKHVIVDILAASTLFIPMVHFLLFKYLFTQKTISTYGSLDALHTGDGWRGFMISEDIEPYMLCFSIISGIICLTISYHVFRNHGRKASRTIALLPIIVMIIMLFVQYEIEPMWVEALVDYRPV